MLPARFPNLLVNGSQGIAVGMATNIPPHNLAEVCNAAVKLIDKPDATLAELMRIVKGPDFPTGGLIMGDDGIKDAFRTGRGTIRVRAVHEIEAVPRGAARRSCSPRCRSRRSVDAIAGKLAELVESGKIDGVRDIRNESGQGKTRLVIELRADTNPQIVLNNLFKHTAGADARSRSTWSRSSTACPARSTSQEALQALARPPGRRRHPAQRSSGSEGRRTRLHIVEGLVKALDMIDAIVKAIRASKDRAAARDRADGQAVRVLRDPGQPHSRHAARPAHAARPRGARRRRSKELEATIKELRAHPRQARRADAASSTTSSSRSATRTRRRAAPRSSATTPAPSTSVALVEDEPYVGHRHRARLRARGARAGAQAGRSRTRGSATRSRR